MQVKVGSQIFDANDQPVMVILSDADKENISQMDPEARKYCAFPEGTNEEEVRRWMGDTAESLAG